MKSLISNKIIRLISLLIGIGIIGFFTILLINRNRTIYIGVVTSDSGPYASEKKQFFDGAKIMADELNQNESCPIFVPWNSKCGINGHVVNVLLIQSKDDASRVSAVIGDFQGDTEWNSSVFYAKKSIPTILITSTNESVGANPYIFRIVPDNQQIGTFLANYARMDIGAQTASIIYDGNDLNSVSLRDGFRDPFISLVNEKAGLKKRGVIVKEWDISKPEGAIDRIMINILSPGSSENPGLIFMAVDAKKSVPILAEMHRKGIKNIIIGNTDLAGESFNQKFASFPEETAQPGYFTEGLYASSPIIFDGANQQAQTFRDNFKTQNQGTDPSWEAAVAYDAMHVIAASVSDPSTSLTNDVEKNRINIEQGLITLNGIKASDSGITGKTFFTFQDSSKSIAVGVFNQGKFISAPVQYYPVEDIRFVPDFNSKKGLGRIITRGGRYYFKTDIIYSGINFNEISNIDENEPSYFVDFYLWFRYQNNDPLHDPITEESIQFINALELPEVKQIENRPPVLGPNEARTLSNNLTYKLFRVKGKFTSAFDFKDYPFDQQEIEIRFRHNEFQRENLIFVVDKIAQSEANGATDPSNVFNTGGDWNVGTTDFYQDSAVVQSALGNPELFQIKNPDFEYSTFNGRIPIWRNLLSFMLRNLLPVLFSIMLAYLSFYLPRTEFSTREGILSGTILSIAFFHLSVSSFLGGIGYTTALDNIFYLFYAIILAGLGSTLLEWLRQMDTDKLEKSLEELKASPANSRAPAKQQIKEIQQRIEENEAYGVMLFKLGRKAYPLILLAVAFGYGYYYRDIIFPKNTASASANQQATATPEQTVVLRLGSWRADDQVSIDAILAEFKNDTGIVVTFEPTVNNDYEKILRLQLENGIAPDLIYLSPNGGRVLDPESLYKQDYLWKLNDLVPELSTAFNPEDLQTWETKDTSAIYGVPIYAVSHGIYYNTKIFKDLGLDIPKTWDELLAVSQKIKDAGIIPIANGTYEKTDPQRIGDYYFLSLAPTYIGGPEGRKMFEAGQRCFNDPSVVRIFKAINDLAPFMADAADLQTLTYTDSVQRFYDGKAAMYFSGSFDINKFEKSAKDINWSVFPIPAPKGYTPYVTFHIDTAIGINKNSKHKDEAVKFLRWLTQKRFGELVGEHLPGFYPLEKDLKGDIRIIQNDKSKLFLAFNNEPGTKLDVRWSLPIANVPDGRTLMQEGIFGIINGSYSPQQAADHLQNGLAQWYPPAQKCVPPSTPTPTPTSIPTITMTPEMSMTLDPNITITPATIVAEATPSPVP